MVKIVVEGAPKHAEDCPFAVDINLTNDYTCLLQPVRDLKCDIERKKICDKLLVVEEEKE